MGCGHRHVFFENITILLESFVPGNSEYTEHSKIIETGLAKLSDSAILL